MSREQHVAVVVGRDARPLPRLVYVPVQRRDHRCAPSPLELATKMSAPFALHVAPPKLIHAARELKLPVTATFPYASNVIPYPASCPSDPYRLDHIPLPSAPRSTATNTSSFPNDDFVPFPKFIEPLNEPVIATSPVAHRDRAPKALVGVRERFRPDARPAARVLRDEQRHHARRTRERRPSKSAWS